MLIRFTNKKLQTISQDEGLMLTHLKEKGVGDPRKAVERIQLALTHIHAAPTMYEVPSYFRPHPLVVDLKGKYSLDITESHRMILRPDHDGEVGFNWENMKSIKKVVIMELSVDYHKKEKK